MLSFAELQEKAKCLPNDVIKAYKQQYAFFGGFFYDLMPPVMNTQAFKEALLISQTAICLEFYEPSEVDLDKNQAKRLALIGMYLFVLQKYSTNAQQILNKYLINLLQDHLKINNLEELDKNFIQACYQQLDTFCDWVFDNRDQHKEARDLYEDFPTNIKIIIKQELTGEACADIQCVDVRRLVNFGWF